MNQTDASSVKLGDLVYAKIAGRIRSGEYAVDTRMPTEKEFSEMLGVSRPVVREALARLRDAGVVVSRRGSGTYVQRKPEVRGEAPLTSIADMRRCLEFRISFEGEAAYHAALGVPEDRHDLIAAITRLQRDSEELRMDTEDDFAFHLAVAKASGNRFFVGTLEKLRESVITAMGITPSFMAVRTPDRLAMLHAEHVAVYDAIMANAPDSAREAMRTHLKNAMQRVFEGVAA
ncbi:FadR/GntR family transcriptional regulator [Sphingobium algorifonticola]|uniref:FadR family transcriptional regulator n=1 Tax=Sphingobium algorifonticola TaxID=2008318 RepID=A0A437JA92_9SPHN|nr:FadR/GntR family transcriptional regulator [Sphingobium algorifonticola]RVT42303.1 FadR family transcriptional regulator [Sphingobium algorifonticola]